MSAPTENVLSDPATVKVGKTVRLSVSYIMLRFPQEIRGSPCLPLKMIQTNMGPTSNTASHLCKLIILIIIIAEARIYYN